MTPSDLAFSCVAAVVLMLLVALSRWLWRGGKAVSAATKRPRAQRDPKPFAGLTQKPDCPACEQEAGVHPLAAAPNAPPPRMILSRSPRLRGRSHHGVGL